MSREKILQSIKENKPNDLRNLPDINSDTSLTNIDKDLIDFQAKALAIGCKCEIQESWEAVTAWIKAAYSSEQQITSPIEEIQTVCTYLLPPIGSIAAQELDPNTLRNIDVAILKGQIGVAENGAVWLSEKEMIARVVPFITQHLIIILNRKHIVCNMHQAYEKIKIDDTGFGVFIAGPSKTADIEQSLVIGAQGARSCTIIIL